MLFWFSHWKQIFKDPKAELIAALNLKHGWRGRISSLSERHFCSGISHLQWQVSYLKWSLNSITKWKLLLIWRTHLFVVAYIKRAKWTSTSCLPLKPRAVCSVLTLSTKGTLIPGWICMTRRAVLCCGCSQLNSFSTALVNSAIRRWDSCSEFRAALWRHPAQFDRPSPEKDPFICNQTITLEVATEWGFPQTIPRPCKIK